MTGPNFYTIDFDREIVLQGKSTTFITIGRNDNVLETRDLCILILPSARTFDAYASVTAVGTTAAVGNTLDNLNIGLTGFSNANHLAFNNIEAGMLVKNSQDFMASGPTSIGPISIGTTGGTGVYKTSSSYSISINSNSAIGGTAPSIPDGITGSATMHIGQWGENENQRWKLNGKSLQEYEEIAYSYPGAYSAISTYMNVMDGTTGSIDTGYLNGTGFVGRRSIGIAVIKNDVLLPNASTSLRIDYDGLFDAHMKFNLVIFAADSNTLMRPNAPVTLADTKISDPYGIKSGTANEVSANVDYQEVHFMGYTETTVRTSRETWQNNFKSNVKVYDDKSSYALLKTNPKLSGNVKITIDSDEDLWLNSIDANNELSDSSYKKYPISSLSTYSRDLYKFFKNGQTPSSIVFDLYQVDDQYQNTKRTLAEQYDNFYNYGVEQLKNRYYDENYSFFAPLWLRKTVPDFFIIFRLDHPLSIESYNNSQNSAIFESFFKDSRIIKTFDMRDTSKLGAYLRDITADPRFKERPLDVSFDSDIATTWNGISYADGTITGKGEFLSDYWKQDRPIIELEEYITSGFERNGVISTNLINLEFLFDDEEATPYSINRYFGLYVTENQLANFQIEPSVLGKIRNQSPSPKVGIDGEPYSLKSFVQTNPNRIELPVSYYHNPSLTTNNTNIPSYQGEVVGKFPLPELVDDPLRIFYIKDRDDTFKRLTKLTEVDYGNPGTNDYKRVTQLQLFDTEEDISKYGGVSQITSQSSATLLNKGKSQLELHLAKVNENQVFADDEEIILTVNQYNHDLRLHTYNLKVKDSSISHLSFIVFKDQYTEVLGTAITIPNLLNDNLVIYPADPTKFIIGQLVYITGSGFLAQDPLNPTYGVYLKITKVNLVNGSVTLVNTGNLTNIAPNTMLSGSELISLGGPTYEVTYNSTTSSNELSVDPILTIGLMGTTSAYSLDNSYTVSIKDSEVQVNNLSINNIGISAKSSTMNQQFRWKMVAKSIGIQPRDSWDYPIEDLNGYDFISAFSNEGDVHDVSIALSKCINSFENRPCDATVINDIIYLTAKRPGLEGNNIEISRNMISGKSNIYNLGFYEKANAANHSSINYVMLPGTTDYKLPIELINNTGIAGASYTYLEIYKTNSGTDIQLRLNVNQTSVESASDSGEYFNIIQPNSLTSFTSYLIPFIVNLSSVPYYERLIYLVKVETGSLISKQLFIGGCDRLRNRAKISYVDSERYFLNRSIQVTGNIITGSKEITNMSLDNIYIGSDIKGLGIPDNSYVTYIDNIANKILINNKATLGEPATIATPNTKAKDAVPYNTNLTIGNLSILNTKIIKDQWYQVQKGVYSPMKPWEVQGKFVYSLPYLEDAIYDNKNHVVGYSNLNDYSIIQLNDSRYEFYQTVDKRIVAYDIYRPILGIFSIFPIKGFDFDFYFSDYSYSPLIEAFRYYFNEEILKDQSLILPIDENYQLYVVNEEDISVNAQITLDIEGLNSVTKEWDKIESLSLNYTSSEEDLTGKSNSIILNTYYPFYVYDKDEHPRKWDDKSQFGDNSQYVIEGSGERNYMRRRIGITTADGSVKEIKPSMYRISSKDLKEGYKIKVNKNDYDNDKDLKSFPGFSTISDIYTSEDAESISRLLNDSKYVEAFLSQSLRSEYDRLRENFNKDYALKSKVVPFITKWVQEGTDARDNYYRLNLSQAFGITNLSPDSNVNYAEPSLLTNEFPYLDTVPKDYPVESLEGSRSYMFAKLSDIAKTINVNTKDVQYSWLDLLTTDETDDWFTKYFAIGYPTELDQLNNAVTKSRDERYTFMSYDNGVKRSQTLFRGAKIQVLDIDTTSTLPTEIIESTKYNDYKFAAIARLLPTTPYIKEAPVSIEFCCNDTFKSILMIINIRLQDYRVQSGLTDYLFFYAVNDQLKNYNQMQSPSSIKIGNHNVLKITDFLPYTAVADSYTDFAVLRPRQGFLGGGYIELGDTRLGGLVIETISDDSKPVYNTYNNSVVLKYKSVSDAYNFSVLNEIIPTLDRYKNKVNAYTNKLNIEPLSITKDGSIFKLITTATEKPIRILHIDRSNSCENNDQYLPSQTIFSGTNKPVFSSVTPGIINISEYKIRENAIFTFNQVNDQIETFNLKGGTSAYAHIKNLLTYASIKEYVNVNIDDTTDNSKFIEYYRIINGVKTKVNDYKLYFTEPDQIIKTGMLAYINDTDKPIEYIGSELIGYELVNTNQNEVVYRHRGTYEPRANDILSFWVRESEDFTKHFETDYLLANTHFNNKSPLSGVLKNYGINKVANAEVLKIKQGSAYKSVYPLINEISIDTKDLFVLNSTWDKDYYKKYNSSTANSFVNGIKEMKEFKSFLGSKAMNVPKSHLLDVFLNKTEITYKVSPPPKSANIKRLTKPNSFIDNESKYKPTLTINIDVKQRLKRKLLSDILLPSSFDEFNWLTTLGISEFESSSLSSKDIENLKIEYLNKNIFQLYQIDQIKLYSLSKQGIPILDLLLSEKELIAAGYRVDKDCKVIGLSDLKFRITKQLDTKKSIGYAVCVTVKRI